MPNQFWVDNFRTFQPQRYFKNISSNIAGGHLIRHLLRDKDEHAHWNFFAKDNFYYFCWKSILHNT